MVTSLIKSYVGRWNAALARKEWRRYGHPTVVVSGGSVSGALTESLTASPNPATVGATVTLTADTGGGTPPYTFTWTTPGPTLSGTGNSRTFTAPTTATNLTFRVLATDSATPAATQEGTVSVQVGASTSGTVLFAGHIPNRVQVGMATPADSANSNPGFTEAQTLIGQPIYEGRRFDGGEYDTATLTSMLNECDAANAYPVLSFKRSSWSAVSSGSYDSTLLQIYNAAVARRTAGKPPFSLTFDHEPVGNSGGTLAEWAAMHTYCSWYFGGRRGGTAGSTYVAGNDVSDIMAWSIIGNGFWWRTNALWTPTGSDANIANPAGLITALRTNKGILMADFYDADYANQSGALTTESLRTPGTGVRTSKRIAQFMIWARQKNSGAVGCGEYGVIDGAEMTATWAVIRANRDLFAVANYFNSNNNSDHEWRVIPANYPAGNGTNSKGLVDFGGNQQSADRLAAFKTTLTESTSSTYTSPL